MPFFEHDDFVHVSSPHFDRLVQYKFKDYADIRTELTEAAATRPGALYTLEVQSGFKYDPLNLLSDPYLADYINMPHCLYYDWMHTLAASGGTGQYAINAVLRGIKIPLPRLDEWHSQFRYPREGITKIKKHNLLNGSPSRKKRTSVLMLASCLLQ